MSLGKGHKASPAGSTERPWLTQPAHWASLSVEAQAADPGSMLNLYRAALLIRRDEADLGDGPLVWWSSPPETLAFARGPRFLSLTNLSGAALPLPPHAAVVLASADVSDHHLPPDATVWLRPIVDGVAEPAWRLPDEDR